MTMFWVASVRGSLLLHSLYRGWGVGDMCGRLLEMAEKGRGLKIRDRRVLNEGRRDGINRTE